MMKKEKSPDLITNIFNGSIVLISICLAVITLFQVTDKSALYLVDECFSITSVLYLLSTVSAYLSMRNQPQSRLAMLSDYFFMSAILSTLASTLVLVIEFQTHA